MADSGNQCGSDSSRRTFLKSGVAAGLGMTAMAGCLGLGGGGGTSNLGLAFTVPVENIGSLFQVPEIQDQLDNLGSAYELEVSRNSSTPDTLNQMAAGEIDMGLLTTVSYASAVQQEAVPGNISMIATDFWDAHADYYGFTIYSKGDSDISKPEDLEGKKLGVNALGTGIHAVFVKRLQQVGIDPDNDVQFVELGFPNFTAAINDGRIDAGIYPALFAVQARGEGFTPVFSSQDAWDEAYPFAYMCASQDALEEKQDAFNAWGEDYVNLVDYIYDNRDDVVEWAAAHFELPPPLVDGFFLTNDDYYRKDVTVDFERLQFIMDDMEALGFLDSSFDVQEYATNDVVSQ
jgi:sulfonate transport system substrate-binding protein